MTSGGDMRKRAESAQQDSQQLETTPMITTGDGEDERRGIAERRRRSVVQDGEQALECKRQLQQRRGHVWPCCGASHMGTSVASGSASPACPGLVGVVIGAGRLRLQVLGPRRCPRRRRACPRSRPRRHAPDVGRCHRERYHPTGACAELSLRRR